MGFQVNFWGVRGTLATPLASHLEFGGNTSCVEVVAGDEVIVLDAGTGIRQLGKRFMRDGVRRATLLMSHTHLDHISGFPFFEPGYRPDFALRVLAGHCGGGGDGECIRTVLEKPMQTPLFPVPLATMQACVGFEDFRPGSEFAIGADVHVRTAALNHPGGAVGYRIEHKGRSFCYVTDTEHVPGQPDRNILKLIEGADLVAYDSSYTDEEFAARRGWGHSTWREGIALCRAAGVKRLCLFHHDPDHDDARMAAIEREAMAEWAPVFAAREGTGIDLLAHGTAAVA
ncbi:MAG TPA: MBL fold metallo-hydrolase [Azospirillaceae bacterium]|nr:MBL fold metallo-hydrolase [Azospirillaceae bacterium]